ncbi:hypothetical protein QF041_003474 [Paenibacillus sp. W2I17]|nr:hypothetical protein [Paenibacillus sp. W2I17]
MTRYLSIQEIIAINVAMIKRYSPGEQLELKILACLNLLQSFNLWAKTILLIMLIKERLLPHW